MLTKNLSLDGKLLGYFGFCHQIKIFEFIFSDVDSIILLIWYTINCNCRLCYSSWYLGRCIIWRCMLLSLTLALSPEGKTQHLYAASSTDVGVKDSPGARLSQISQSKSKLAHEAMIQNTPQCQIFTSNKIDSNLSLISKITRLIDSFSGLSWPPNIRASPYFYPPDETKISAQFWGEALWDGRERNQDKFTG